MALQIVHLSWLTCNVTLPIFFNFDLFKTTGYELLYVSIDYLEIPSLIVTLTNYTILLFNKDRMGINLLFIILLALQFTHIFWITDEFIIDYLYTIPLYLLIFVVFIDYSELFIIGDLAKKTFSINKHKKAKLK